MSMCYVSEPMFCFIGPIYDFTQALFEGFRPSAMLIDDLVDLLHEADDLVEGDNDFLITGEVVGREGAALPVLEPFVADPVTANVEVLDLLRHTVAR